MEIEKEIEVENIHTNDIVLKLIIQNDELKQQNKEITEEMRTQNKLLLENIEKNSKNIVVSNNSNNTNKFNLNVFLNEHCKDAMNMNDFIDSIETTLEDAIATTRLGFVEGVTKQIEKLTANIGGIHRRPFHCTDEKRSVLMIKNNNEWTKDESVDKAELMRLVNKVEGRNCMKIHEYQRDNPACYSLFTPEGELIGRMLSVLVGRENNDKEKIIRKIMKQICIEK
jgi:galactokinase/mevalonate kinase-like predicted kinase